MTFDNSKNLRVIFMGTPEFAVPSLVKLIENFNVIAVVTQPDKPVGRKQVLTASPVKKIAEKNQILVIQPEKLRNNLEITEQLKSFNPDLIVVAAYGLIIPKEIIELAKYGIINVHASLLPRWRGASPINHAILYGDQETGITIMEIDEQMDHGRIISQQTVKIEHNDNAQTLSKKLEAIGGDLLVKTIPDYISGHISPQVQDESLVTYASKLSKESGKIDWNKPAIEIERMIRAFNPWPEVWTIWQDKKIKITEASVTENEAPHSDSDTGKVYLNNKNLAVYCQKNSLIIKKLQLEGKKEQLASEFLNGHQDFVGTNLSLRA